MYTKKATILFSHTPIVQGRFEIQYEFLNIINIGVVSFTAVSKLKPYYENELLIKVGIEYFPLSSYRFR
jgi:hypothetical protein